MKKIYRITIVPEGNESIVNRFCRVAWNKRITDHEINFTFQKKNFHCIGYQTN